MRRQALVLADAQIDRGLTEVDRHELGVDVGEMQQGDLPAHVPVSRYPTMHRDLAVVVDEAVAAQAVLDEVRRAAGEALYKLELFDVYRGEGVDSGRKSLAFSLTLQVSSRTLTDVEVDSIVAGAVGALRQRFGAQLRT